MSKVVLQGNFDPAAQQQLEAAVLQYAHQHPNTSNSDQITLIVADADGKPCEVTGSFQRDCLGNLVFTLISGLLRKLVGELKQRAHESPRQQRRSRKERLRGAAGAGLPAGQVVGALPDDAEGRYRYFKGAGLLRKEKNGYRMAGGLTFADKDAVLAHLMGATGSGDKAATTPEKAGKPAKAKAAAKQPKGKASGTKATEVDADAVLAKLLAKGTLNLQVGMYRHTDGRHWRGKAKVLDAIATGELKK